MNTLFIAATEFELDVARELFRGTGHTFLCTGVGPDATLSSMDSVLSSGRRFDLAVDIGICGSYTERLRTGTVVQVVTEQYGGQSDELLCNADSPSVLAALPRVSGNTVPELDARYRKVDADVETMEGAAFFVACLSRGILFAEIRAVSNRVGETDHSFWDIPLALKNLKESLKLLI